MGGADAREYTGLAALQGHRVYARVLKGLPSAFQQQSLLRIHRQRLSRADAEEPGVESVDAIEKPAGTHIAGPRMIWIRVVETIQIPAAIRREGGDGVSLGYHEPPKLLRRGYATRITAAHPDNRKRLFPPRMKLLILATQPLGLLEGSSQRLADQITGIGQDVTPSLGRARGSILQGSRYPSRRSDLHPPGHSKVRSHHPNRPVPTTSRSIRPCAIVKAELS